MKITFTEMCHCVAWYKGTTVSDVIGLCWHALCTKVEIHGHVNGLHMYGHLALKSWITKSF